jgi:CRISPR type III-B/RAMP module-associated protein Cmr5
MPEQSKAFSTEQERAAMAFDHVAEIDKRWKEGNKQRTQYGSLAAKLPSLLRSAGLCQGVHFLKTRAKAAPSNQEQAATALLNHLGRQLRRVDPTIDAGSPGASLCEKARKSELETYLWLSREAIASANWYARLAKSELGYVAGEDGE